MSLYRMAGAGLLLAHAACTSVRSVQPAQFIPQHSPAIARVTSADGSVAVVAQPRIVGDTLFGSGVGTLQPFAMALKDIQRVQVRTPNHTRTALLATGLLVAGGLGTYVASQAGSGAANLSNCGDKDAERGAVC